MTFRFSETTFFKRAAKVTPFLALTFMTGLLWSPFGLQIGYYMDEWPVLAQVQAGHIFWSLSRPFLLFPWLIAYFLDSNSFLGTNLLLMLLILGKVILLYLIVRDFGFDQLFAFGTAVLGLFYPADTGIFFFSGLTIHFTVLMYLLAVWFFIHFWKSNRLWLWIPIVITSALCVGSYEATYPLFLLVPFILVYQKRGFTRRIIVTSIAWLLTPLGFGLLYIAVALSAPSAVFYQTSVVADDNSPVAILASLWNVIRYTYVDSWTNAFVSTFLPTGWHGFRNAVKYAFGNPYFIYALVAAVILIIGVVALWKFSPVKKMLLRRYFEVAVAGLVLLCLSILIYLPTNLRYIHQRTLLYASLGAALTLSVGFWLLGLMLGRVKLVYVTLLVILVIPAVSTLLFQHRDYATYAYRQTPFMQAFVKFVPQLISNTTVIVIDDTPKHVVATTFTYLNVYFDTMLQIIYSDSTLDGMVCYPNDKDSNLYFYDQCHFEANQVTLTNKGGTVLSVRYDQLIVFRYDAQKGLQLEYDLSPYIAAEVAQRQYVPSAHVDTTMPMPLRAHTMLGLGE